MSGPRHPVVLSVRVEGLKGVGADSSLTALLLGIAFISFAAAVGLTAVIRAYAVRKSLLDVPNVRSSHDTPTPRGGGFAVVVIFTVVSVWLWLYGYVDAAALAAIVGGGLMVALIGFWDDHGHVSAQWRFLVHLLAGTWALAVLGGLFLSTNDGVAESFGLGESLVAVICLAWLVNLYNFMDGIDGIAAVEAITVAVGAAVILVSNGALGYSVWLASFACAVAGFLVWNWPPARIFMGDTGSGFIGFVLGAMSIASSQLGSIELWSWAILMGVFITDATVTLVRRILRGETWYRAHRSHAYQRIARYWRGHRPVTMTVGAINVLWLFPLAWLATFRPSYGYVFAAIAYGPLVVLAVASGAGKPDQEGPMSAENIP